MLTLKNFVPTPAKADALLEWLKNDVGIKDIVIIYELLEFITEKNETEFAHYITQKYLIDNEK